jgi:DNA-binding transcriptional MerR regulator
MFNISPATVRNWANDFNDYFSPSANPPAGQTRSFTDDDIAVFATIHRLKDKHNLTVDEIKEQLDNGVRDNAPVDIPSDLLDIAGSSAVQLIIAKMNDFEQRLKALETGGNTELREQVERKDERIEQLAQEIGRLKALLEIANKKDG